MGINKFTKEQIEKLNKNPYVQKVSETNITYSEEFKNEFINLYKDGKTPSEIFRSCGFDVDVLKNERIKQFSSRCKKYALRSEGVTDGRRTNKKGGRPRVKEMTIEEELTFLKHKNLVLEQENDFLKKMISLSKKTEWEKSRHKKSTK